MIGTFLITDLKTFFILHLMLGQHYSDAVPDTINVHHNAFDNVAALFYQIDEDSSNYNVTNLNIYSNIMLNGTNAIPLHIQCANNGSALGTVDDNAFYDSSDNSSALLIGFPQPPQYVYLVIVVSRRPSSVTSVVSVVSRKPGSSPSIARSFRAMTLRTLDTAGRVRLDFAVPFSPPIAV